MSNNFETILYMRNMSINHDYKTGINLLDSVYKISVKRRPAKKSRWRHMQLAIKPRYLWNHATQIKSYYRMLSGSHGSWSLFQNLLWKIAWSAPGGEIPMTSYPACNKTSLSRKPCIPDKTLLWTSIRMSWSLFQNPLWNSACSAPCWRDWRWRHKRLPIKPRYLRNHEWELKTYYGTLSESHGRSFRIRHEKSPEVTPSGELTMRSYPVGNKNSLSRKPCISDIT